MNNQKVANPSSIKGFRWLQNTKFCPPTGAGALVALGVPSRLCRGFEMDDPIVCGKRDRHIKVIRHEGDLWETIWMYRANGKKTYGLRRYIGPI